MQRFAAELGITAETRVLDIGGTPDCLHLLPVIPRVTLLNTPPADRQPILTYVGGYDERAVAEAIRRELLREGQVFFVHNRVQDIEVVARRLREMVPEARVAIDQMWTRMIPTDRIGRPEEAGAAAVWLCADAPYVTGHSLIVDGGLTSLYR